MTDWNKTTSEQINRIASSDDENFKKLKKIDNLLGNIPETLWPEVFDLLKTVNAIKQNFYYFPDLLLILLKYKDYDGSTYLNNITKVVKEEFPYLFNIEFKTHTSVPKDINGRYVNLHYFNPTIINFHPYVYKMNLQKSIIFDNINGMDIILRGTNFLKAYKSTLRKMHQYPNIQKYLLYRIHDITKQRRNKIKQKSKIVKEKIESKQVKLDFNNLFGTS